MLTWEEVSSKGDTTMKLLILSDIHGNWPALEAVLRAEPGYDAIACCGDIVGYGPHPIKCLHWVTEHAHYRVRGNHDNALGFDVDCRCMGCFRDYSIATRAWHRSLLSEAEREFLRKLPTIVWFKWAGRHFRIAHATPQGDMFECLTMDQWSERVKDLDCDFVFLGHTHVQGMHAFGESHRRQSWKRGTGRGSRRRGLLRSVYGAESN